MPPETLRANDAALILVDAMEGPLAMVRSIDPVALRRSLQSLAKGAALLQIPILQLHAPLPGPAARPIVDTGSIVPHATNDAWRTTEVIEAVKATGRTQLLFAGIATEVGVALTAMSANRAGYDCTVLLDACGTVSPRTESAAVQRLTLCGIPLHSWSGCLAELQVNYAVGRGPDLLHIVSSGLENDSLLRKENTHA